MQTSPTISREAVPKRRPAAGFGCRSHRPLAGFGCNSLTGKASIFGAWAVPTALAVLLACVAPAPPARDAGAATPAGGTEAAAPGGDTAAVSSHGDAGAAAPANADRAGLASGAGTEAAAVRRDPTGAARSYPGFLPEGFATEPLALLPPATVSLPPVLAEEPRGGALRGELERMVLDRLPEEIRILHSRAPVLGFRDWAGPEEVGPRSGFLRSVLDWGGTPGPEGQLPEIVGNSVEALGDARGIRYFLFPRALAVIERDPLHYRATLEAYLLDARGERVVWSGTGAAEGRLPENRSDTILAGVVHEAARAAVADLAASLPGYEPAGGKAGFSDVQQ